MKKRDKRLSVHRETIRTLTDESLHGIAAAASDWTGFSSCMSPSECPRGDIPWG